MTQHPRKEKKDAFWRQDHKSSLSSSFSCNRHTSLPHLKCIISQERLGVAESMPSKLKRHLKIPTTPSKRNDLFMSNSQRYITYHCLWLDFALQSDGVKVCLCVTWVRAQSLSLTKKIWGKLTGIQVCFLLYGGAWETTLHDCLHLYE